MKNRCELKATPEFLNNTKVNDEYLFRDLARKMVSEMPLEELHKLINLTKIDPNSDQSEKVLRESMDRFKIEQIHQLRSERVIFYSAKVDVVSQQRELLKAFQDHYQSDKFDDERTFYWSIDNFLKAFNCG